MPPAPPGALVACYGRTTMRWTSLPALSCARGPGWLLSALLAILLPACGQSESPSDSAQGGGGGGAVTPAQGGEEPNAGAAQEPNGGAPAAAGSGASGGRMAACDQPGGDAGPCDALVHAWFFDKMRGACMPYVYGGCQASDNHFESQVECEGACGGALYSTCPAAPNDGSCDGSVTTCRYTPEGCACLQTSPASFDCVPADPECGDASEYPTSCTCASGSWHCAARPMP
jgi:hypothetical protein